MELLKGVPWQHKDGERGGGEGLRERVVREQESD